MSRGFIAPGFVWLMPELPDVETFKRYLDSTSLGQTVRAATVRDPHILDGLSPQQFQRRVKGQQLKHSRRHGKYLFVELPADKWLILHFGMTGFLSYSKEEKPRERPHNRLVLHLENGYSLAFNCRRKLGFAGFTTSLPEYIARKKLGPDALGLEYEQFTDLLGKARGQLKSFLMNQQLLAGMGNEYSDEILFQARLHPQLRVSSLDEKTTKLLFRTMRRVLNTAIRKKVDPKKFPRTYLTPRRSPDATCPRCGTQLRTLTCAGRTAYFCPKEQQLP